MPTSHGSQWKSPPLPLGDRFPSLDRPADDTRLAPELPRVFVYENLSVKLFPEPAQSSPKMEFAAVCKNIQAVNQFGGAELVHHRLLSTSYRARSPAKADLYFVPMMLKSMRTLSNVKASCARLRDVDVAGHLPHFNRHTAHRHFFFFSREHWACQGCCAGWWSYPRGLLARSLRVAYSEVFPLEWRDGCCENRYMKQDPPYHGGVRVYPNLRSVPFFPAVPQAGKLPPWTSHAGRADILMLFVGNAGRGYHGDAQVRGRIAQQCAAYDDDAVCTHIRPKSPRFRKEKIALRDAIELKKRAVFCLEPAGDTPFRKSFAESIVSGCIPVLFHPFQDYGFGWLWDGWREESRVLINRTAFVAGEVDLLAHLKRLPTESVSRMQRTIERRGRQFSVSCDADDRSDYFGLMLRGLSAQADRSESGMLTKGSRSWT